VLGEVVNLTDWWLSRYRMMSVVRLKRSVPTTRAK
jgi:hypothetical protein